MSRGIGAAVFVGPTLDPADLPTVDGLQFLPPASLGDISRLCAHHPKVIGIIDGYFEQRPPVWHKEILWALESGIHVVGASSMGALRAAELCDFGMEGVGSVFGDFRDGRLVRDDEVAVAHTVEGDRYRATSEALVDIRATVEAAELAGIIDPAVGLDVVAAATATFYPERRWDSILDAALEQGTDTTAIGRLRGWVRDHAVGVKRRDALALIDRVIELCEDRVGPKSTTFVFSQTRYWAEMRGHVDNDADLGGLADATPVLEELRLSHHDHDRVRQHALMHRLALRLADHENAWPAWAEVQEGVDDLRHARELYEPDAMAQWLHHNELDESDAGTLFLRKTRVERIVTQNSGRLNGLMLDVLKLEDCYGALAERARSKHDLLSARGMNPPALDQLGLDEDGLIAWHCARVGLARPSAPELDEWAEQLGFAGRFDLVDSLAREYAYVSITGEEAADPSGAQG